MLHLDFQKNASVLSVETGLHAENLTCSEFLLDIGVERLTIRHPD